MITNLIICEPLQKKISCFGYPFSKQALVFMCLQYKSFEDTVGKDVVCYK